MSNVNWILRTFLFLTVIAFLVTLALAGHAASATVPDAEALLKRSDEAVYAAKAAGRNMVIARAA